MRFSLPLKDNWIAISITLIILIIFKDIIGIKILIILISYWLIKLKNKNIILIIIILLLAYIPRYKSDNVSTFKGKVKNISYNYIIVENYNSKIIAYTNEPILLDTQILLEGKFLKLYTRESFYSFDFSKYLMQKGIYYQIKNPNITLLKEPITARSYIQKYINNLNFNNKSWLYKILLNIKIDDELEEIFISSGFCFIGFLLILKKVLSKVFYKNNITKIEINTIIILIFIYNFQLHLIKILILKLLKYVNLSRGDRFGLSFVILLLIDKSQVFNLGFWIIFSFYYSNYLFKEKSMQILYLFFIQGIFNNSFNILKTVLYNVYVYILGLFYFLALITLIIKNNIFYNFIEFIENIYLKLTLFEIGGNPMGIGLLIIINIFIFLKKYNQKWKIITIIYILFLKLSLIHLNSEVSFINIGQGDSILIRSTFNQTNILIDTGSKYQYKYLKNYLKAKGISTIDLVIISHYDEDHSGGLEQLNHDFNIKEIIDYHFSFKNINNINILELNENNYNNENDNSLVNYISINNISFLFTGDISKDTEIDLIKKYNLLDVDVLKLAHHGSNTSTSKQFIKQVNPKLSIISSGKYNRYKHPSEEVINLLENEGIFYLNTAFDGDITIYFTKLFNIFYTSDKRIGIIK